MRMMQELDEVVDDLLRALPPAPRSWVARAEEIPLLEWARAQLEELESNASDMQSVRAALEAVGMEPNPDRIRMLARLRDHRSGC